MRVPMVFAFASVLLAGCASGDPCRAPTERELRQGVIRGVSASCIPAASPAAPANRESEQ